MAVLETIRVKLGILITVLIAVALLSFIIDPTSLSLFSSDYANQETQVASVNGHDITYSEFSQKYSQYTDYVPYEAYEASVLQSNPDMDPSEIKKIYNQEILAMTMNDFLMEDLYVVKAKEAGFAIGDEEMYQLLSGKIFSNTIFSNFRGQMTPQLLAQIETEAAGTTPEARAYGAAWNNIKKATEQERYVSKYSTTFSKSMLSNPLLLEDEIQNSNNVFDVEFVMVPFGAADTSVVVTEEEVKAYYTDHQDLFPCIETRDLHYIVVDVEEATEDAEYEKLDSVLNNVNGVENFRKAAMENGYIVDSTPVAMRTNSFGSVTGVENLVKWSFKETEPGVVSDIYTIENNDKTYLVVAALGNITPEGHLSVEDPQVQMFIERTLLREKLADKKLAEVSEKVNGLTDLNEVANALGVQVSTKKNLTFAKGDFDPKFTGAASVAAEGVVSAPFKGSEGIYVYKVTNRSVESFFTENDYTNSELQLNMMYGQMLQMVLTKEGNVKDNSYLYF